MLERVKNGASIAAEDAAFNTAGAGEQPVKCRHSGHAWTV